MAKKSFITDIDLKGNKIENAKLVGCQLVSLATAPRFPEPGQIYFDTTKNAIGIYGGIEWVYFVGQSDI